MNDRGFKQLTTFLSRRILLLIIANWWTYPYLYAQEQVMFRHLNKKDGLSQNSVFAIAQDQTGYMWFGTRDGLNRYDGIAFHVYRHDPAHSRSLVSNDIRVLYRDPFTNALWIGTPEGLSRYDETSDTFVNYLASESNNSLSSNAIRCIFRDSKRRLWVGTDSGADLYHAEKDAFIRALPDDAPAFNTGVNAIFEDKKGTLWVGTDEGLGRLVFNANGGFTIRMVLHRKNKRFQLADYRIKAIQQDKKENLWLGTEQGGVHFWQRTDNSIYVYRHNPTQPLSLSHDQIRSMAFAPDGSLWVGTFLGLNRWDPKTRSFQPFMADELQENSLSNSSIWAVFFDRSGGLWVGTYHGGVNYYAPGLNRFQNYVHVPNRNSLSSNIVSSFAEDQDGNFWIGTEGGGLNFWDRKTGKFQAFKAEPDNPSGLSGNNVKTILKDSHQLWIGLFQQGLNRYDLRSKAFRQYKTEAGNPATLNNNNVYSLLKEDQRLWIATYGGGLNILDLKTEAVRTFQNQRGDSLSLSSDLTRVLYKDGKNRIWLGTEKGLNLVLRDPQTGLPRGFQHFLPDVQVYALLTDTRGHLWIGTFTHGLFSFNPTTKAFIQYTEQDGLPGHTIFGMLLDNNEQLWLSTNNGLSKLDLAKQSFTNYTYSNGLKNLEFNFNGYYKARTGELFFGGMNGFTVFQPSNILENQFVPPLVLTGLKVMNEEVYVRDKTGLLPQALHQTSQLRFRYNEAIFSIRFAALDFLNPGSNQYAFKLEGLDKDWNYRVGPAEARYTIQRPGVYHFRVKGGNSDGIWNPEEKTIEIVVLPPPWRTTWAYLGYFLILSLGMYGVFHLFQLRQRLQMEHWSKIQQEELNEMKLRFFTNITHEFRTPLTLILGPIDELLQNAPPAEMQKTLYSVQRNAQRLLNLVNQILTFRKLESDHEHMAVGSENLVFFLRDICQSFEESARLRQIHFTFSPAEAEIDVWFDRDKLEKVFFNLLSNAFKFTPDSGTITVSVSKTSRHAVVKVQDNGNGIKPALHHHIFKRFNEKVSVPYSTVKGSGIGLALSKQMIELHHGNIRVDSALHEGATFIVELPLGKEHFKEGELLPIDFHSLIHSEKDIAIPTKIPDFSWLQEPEQLPETDAPLVLIVEDNPEVMEYIQRIFHKSYRTISATDGKAGLALARKAQPDLIVSDVMMPEMDGIALCMQLKTNIKTSHIPVILLTAYTAAPMRIKGLEIGADDYVTKPFNPDELRLRVRNLILARRQLHEKFVRVLNLEPKEITVTSADETFLKQVLDIVERHIENPDFSIEQFAQELAVSRPLLFTKLKALTDQTPNNFIKTIRLKRAAQLLVQDKLTIAEVAFKVGFRDTRYFSKSFQKQFQETPSAYMESYRNPNT